MKNSKNTQKAARQTILRNELAKDSLLVRKNSMEVLALFEQLNVTAKTKRSTAKPLDFRE